MQFTHHDNKHLLVPLAALLLVCAVVTALEFFVADSSNLISFIADGSFALATLAGAYLLITSGTIRSTVYWRIINVGMAIIILGSLFKILHLVGADQMLLIGYLTVGITYTVRFMMKPSKGHLDVLKVLTVVFFSVATPLRLLHYIYADYADVGKILFWMTMLDFAYLELRKSSSVE